MKKNIKFSCYHHIIVINYKIIKKENATVEQTWLFKRYICSIVLYGSEIWMLRLAVVKMNRERAEYLYKQQANK